MGSSAGANLNSGSNNIGFGPQAGNVIGNNNISIGMGAGATGNGSDNIYVGKSTGGGITGSRNLIIGHTENASLLTGSFNTFIGRVETNTATLSNTIILADGEANQRLYIASNGYAGINLASDTVPGNRLEITEGVTSAGLRFRNLTSGTSATTNTLGRVLTVNNVGDVILVDGSTGGSGTTQTFNNGANTTLIGAGTVASPYHYDAKTLYTDDGTISPPVSGVGSGVRTVTMGNNNLVFNRDASSAATGKIYIGSAAPSFPTTTGNYNLYVEGGILTEKVKVALRSSTFWADYVFAEDYKLMPLKEIAAFVKEKKHLPGVRSSAEIAKEGLDLAQMQSKQMEKIEELTLHAIQQEQRLDQQQQEIEDLKLQVKALLNRK